MFKLLVLVVCLCSGVFAAEINISKLIKGINEIAESGIADKGFTPPDVKNSGATTLQNALDVVRANKQAIANGLNGIASDISGILNGYRKNDPVSNGYSIPNNELKTIFRGFRFLVQGFKKAADLVLD